MRCIICKKGSEMVNLYDGIYDSEMIKVCEECSELESIPIIKRPTESQIKMAEEHRSVRQRMEQMSEPYKKRQIEEDRKQKFISGQLARLKPVPRKQFHEDVLDDYYWKVNMGRRRKKLTLNQLAEKTGVDASIIEGIEKGKIPEDFVEIFIKLENFFDVKLLKDHKREVHFKKGINHEKEILDSVRAKMGLSKKDEDIPLKNERIEEVEITDEEDDFKYEYGENVTLNDLIDAKRKRDKKVRDREEREKRNSLIGDDIDLDLEDV